MPILWPAMSNELGVYYNLIKSHFFIFKPILLGDCRLANLRVGHFRMRFAWGSFWLKDDKILYYEAGENGDKTQDKTKQKYFSLMLSKFGGAKL